MIERITTIKDQRISEARELATSVGRARIHKCLLEGAEAIQWALEAHWPIEHVFYHDRVASDSLLTTLLMHHIPCYAVTEGILKKISDTSYLVPFIGVASLPDELSSGTPLDDFVLVLDRVQDHGNIGTIIRSSIGREIHITGKMIMQALDAELHKVSDLNNWQVVLLMILKCDEVMTLEQVSKDTATFGQELSDFLHPLFTHHYIQHCPPPHEHSIQLTEAGERTIAQLWNVVEKAENRVLSGFSDAEKAQLNDFLKRIQTNCQEITHA